VLAPNRTTGRSKSFYQKMNGETPYTTIAPTRNMQAVCIISRIIATPHTGASTINAVPSPFVRNRLPCLSRVLSSSWVIHQGSSIGKTRYGVLLSFWERSFSSDAPSGVSKYGVLAHLQPRKVGVCLFWIQLASSASCT